MKRRGASLDLHLSAWLLAACALGASLAGIAQANTVRDVTRLRGQGESVLEGIGLVIGLDGTGDDGGDLVVARPLAERLRQAGNPVPSLDDLANAESVALVMVSCVIPRSGAEVDDALDVRVSAINGASSLAGGQLLVSPLNNAVPGGQVYAFAQGPVALEDAENPRNAIVRGGARVVRPVRTTPEIAEGFELVIEPSLAGWSAAAHIAESINDAYFLTPTPNAEPIATATGPRSVLVRTPQDESANPARFVADVLDTQVTPSLMGLPAMVVANTRTGVIVVTGDVRLSPAIITHKDLVITTTLPPVEPTPETPATREDRWVTIETGASERELARIEDLLAAFDQLDVPPADQVNILETLHQANKLHGKLVIDGMGR